MTNKDIENGKYTAVQAPQADVIQDVATKKPTIKKETGPFKSIPVEERMAQGAAQIAEVTSGGIRIVDNKTSKNLEHSVVSNEEIADIYKNSKDIDGDLTKPLPQSMQAKLIENYSHQKHRNSNRPLETRYNLRKV